MIKVIVGFVLGYWVASNKEQAKVYWEKLKTWLKEKCNKDTQNKNNEVNNEIINNNNK